MKKSTPTPTRSQQQSISSFFTKKTVNGVAQSQQLPVSQATSEVSQFPAPQGNLYDADSDEDARQPLRSRPNGSAKRTTPDDVVEEDDTQRPSKRARAGDDGESAFFSN